MALSRTFGSLAANFFANVVANAKKLRRLPRRTFLDRMAAINVGEYQELAGSRYDY